MDLDEVLRTVIDGVTGQVGADRGTLYLIDHARNELVSHIAHLPEIAEIRLRIGEGVAGWVAQRGQGVNIPEGQADARFERRVDDETGYVTRSMLATPIRGEGRAVIGVLQVLNRQDGDFTLDDEALLERLADEVGELLEGTSLASQLRPGLRQPLAFKFNRIVGESPAMQAVFDRTARAARTDATVLIRGESGSGKEVVARAVHDNSPRRDGPFVKVDCAALPAQLIENELFGHERGAFTGADRAADGMVAAAAGGTLFLDEVGELPSEVQGRLLRLVQDRAYTRVGGTDARTAEVRFVAATHRDLEAEVARGQFRQDLYYRLRVVQIDMPTLRDRGPADLDRLIDHFLFEHSRRHRPGRPSLLLTHKARAALHAHDWPGNVRELEHVMESATVLARGAAIEAGELSLGSSRTPFPGGLAVSDPNAFVFPIGTLRDLERAYVAHVLARCGGNKTEASRLLGIGRNTLARKLDSSDWRARTARAGALKWRASRHSNPPKSQVPPGRSASGTDLALIGGREPRAPGGLPHADGGTMPTGGNMRIGAMIVGLRGATASTTVAAALGCEPEALKPFLITETGSAARLPMVRSDEIVFGGWDTLQETWAETLARHRVLDHTRLPGIDAWLEDRVHVFKAAALRGDHAVVSGEAEETDHTGAKILADLRKDIRRFKEEAGVDRVVVVQLGAPGTLVSSSRWPQSARGFVEALQTGLFRTAAPYYAGAALLEGCALIDYTASATVEVPGLIALAEREGVPVAGRDGSTGQTLLKSVLAQTFATRRLYVKGWYSLCADKEAWDAVDFHGLLGARGRLRLDWQCSDSLLAAPAIIDLIRLSAHLLATGRKGLQDQLGLFFKHPLGTEERRYLRLYDVLERFCAREVTRLYDRPLLEAARPRRSARAPSAPLPETLQTLPVVSVKVG